MGTRLEGGHTDSIYCVIQTHGPDRRLVSGGEGGELCIWAPNNSSHIRVQLPGDDEVSSLAPSAQHPHLLYVSSGCQIFKVDLSQEGRVLDTFKLNEDDINEIALSEKEDFLCAADDSGVIRVINLAEGKVHKTLRKHSNICATACFRPRRPWEVISGGYDSFLMQWDFSKGRSFCRINLEEHGAPPEEADSYLVSPPFIHSVALHASGSLLACGTESALIHLFNATKKTLSFLVTLRAHSLGVSQVHFPSFETDLLVTGGNDGNIFFWKVSLDSLPVPMSNGHASGTHSPPTSPSPLSSIKHGAKINWLTSGISAEQQKFIVVADNSSHLTLYSFPQ